MPGYEEALQFPRGTTYSDRGLVTMSSTTRDDLLGKIRNVPDTIHGRGIPVELRYVRLAAAITGDKLAVIFDTDEGFGRIVSGYDGTGGGISKPLDELYDGMTLTQYDIVYVVESGPCTVTLGGTVSAGNYLSTDSASKYIVATTGLVVTAIAIEGGDANEEVVVHVLAGLKPAIAA